MKRVIHVTTKVKYKILLIRISPHTILKNLPKKSLHIDPKFLILLKK